MKKDVQKISVVLAGNPNVGKSTLFNNLTGLRQHTGNWPGKTVEIARGTCRRKNILYDCVDLPGTYSLSGMSEDERLAAEYIEKDLADCTVVVCDGSCLERNLILALQVLQRTERVVLCVNLMDEAERMGIQVDGNKLSQILGIPVVMSSATTRKGQEELLKQIRLAAKKDHVFYTPLEPTVQKAQEIAEQCVISGMTSALKRQRRIEKLLVSRGIGIPLMLLLFFGIIWITVWGANYPSQILERLFDRGYFMLEGWLQPLPAWIRGPLLDGMYVTAGRVISVMLPPMAIFFPLFTMLEDIGYLPRMAFLLDRGMSPCGGCGKQALTMCMGLGCNAVGVTGCRIINSPRERTLAILTNAFVPCNGRFPTLILLGSFFFSGVGSAFFVALFVLLGILGAMGVSGVLSKTVLQHEQSVFMMEMPPFRKPRILQILVRSLLDRTLFIAVRAALVAAPVGIILWIGASSGVLTPLAAAIEPAGEILGMNGIILLAFFLSLPANELLIPVILLLMTKAHSLQQLVPISGEFLMAAGWTWKTAACTMMFALFHWPCATTLMTIYKETKSAKKTAAAFFLPTAVGVIACLILNIILQRI